MVQATEAFSGSECEQAIISALYDAFDEDREVTGADILQAAREIIPLAYTMKEKIDYLREWAKTRARGASFVVEDDEPDDDTEVRQLEV